MSQKVVMRPITGATQIVNISGVSASTAVPLVWGVHRLLASVDCFIRYTVGGSVAVVTDMPLLAGTPEYFERSGYDTVSVITAGSTGTLTVTAMG